MNGTNGKRPNIEFFTYSANFSNANLTAAGGTETQTIQIQNDSDFVIVAAHYMADIAAAAQLDGTRVIPLCTVLMTNGATNRLLSAMASSTAANQGIPVPAFFGGREPLYLPKPLVLPRNSTFQIQVWNYDAAVAYNLRLSLVGYKVF